MAVSHTVWRFLAFGFLTVMLGLVAACGDDEGATPRPQEGDGTITGRVTDTSGAAIVGATVGTNPSTSIALTDAQGNFSITDVDPGTYAVIASKEGFESAAGSATVAAGQTATVNLTLTPRPSQEPDTTGTLTGFVLRRSGDPVPAGTTVEIFRDGTTCDTDDTPTFTATTEEGGLFIVPSLPAGSYLACATVTIGGQDFVARTAFAVNGGETTSITLTVGRDLDQTTDPNVDGEALDLDEQGNFNGIIRFVDVDGDGDDDEDCNVINSQHLWVVEVFQDLDDDGVVDVTSGGVPTEPLVSGVRVEWSLNDAGGGVIVVNPTDSTEVFVRGTTGVIVDTDDPFLDPVQAESAKTAGSGVAPQFKVDSHHAVTYTNDADQVLDFDGEPVTIGAGQTWIIVSSPIEGFTDVIAFSPDLSRATRENGDKAFGLKRWVNWRIEVAELLPDAGADTLFADIVEDGGVLINRLDRTPQAPGGIDCALAAPGTICDLSNRAHIGIAITRLRTDSPFTFIDGTVEFTIADDSPDADIDDIDSDVDLGGALFAGGGTISTTENFGTADFSMDSPVSFECEVDPFNLNECLDVDVVVPGPNSAGQTLDDIGFTVTPGAEDEQAAVAVTLSLDSLAGASGTTGFFATASDTTPVGFVFSQDQQRLIEGRGDNENTLVITILDEFGEVCDEIVVTKRWVTSILRIFKQGPATVSLEDAEGDNTQFEYTVTVVNDGDDLSSDVVIADTLPILDVIDDLDEPGDRDGDQAFRYVTDDPTFDPDGIRYYIDTDDNGPGTTTDVCFEAPIAAGAPAGTLPDPAFPRPAGPGEPTCDVVVPFTTIEAARDAAEAVSAGGSQATPLTGNTTADQVVIVEYFDEDVLARTAPGGAIEAEDSFEITLETISSVNAFAIGGEIPERDEENGEWCNIATVTSAENDFDADSVCTRVVEALIEVRKTVDDAIVTAGDQAEFTIEIANNGSEDLTDVTVSDTLDVLFTVPGDTINEPGLVMIDTAGTDCEGLGCTFTVDTIASGATRITITIPVIEPTDVNENGIFDDNEGFLVARLVTRTPLRQGTFCNRVTVSDDQAGSDTDIACVVTQVEIEFDIVNNDGTRNVSGDFEDVETFQLGDSIVYQTSITNRSNVSASNVQVLWEISPEFRIIQFVSILDEDPTAISCSASSDTCSVTVASLGAGESIILNYLTFAEFTGNDVNRITLTANELSLPVVNEEPTTVNP